MYGILSMLWQWSGRYGGSFDGRMADMEDTLQKAVDYIKTKMDIVPRIGLVLGSGLGDAADIMEDMVCVPYRDIPGFPCSTVAGHKGRFIFGHIDSVPVVVMQGRVHYYEGYSMEQCVMPVRTMFLLGAGKLILTNASGGIAGELDPGDMMILTDHISTFIPSPLIGKNKEELGPRFPDMTEVYSGRINHILEEAGAECGIKLRKGVYLQVTGPQYETPAEIRFYGLIGADAVGMSTVCEAIAAKHMGMEIAGISVVCNKAAGLGGVLSHEDIIKTGDTASDKLKKLILASINRIDGDSDR